MGLLDKLKGSREPGAASGDEPRRPTTFDELQAAVDAGEEARPVRRGQAPIEPEVSIFNEMAQGGGAQSTVAMSSGNFVDSRLRPRIFAPTEIGSGLPVIGAKPLPEQQRLLALLLGLGLLLVVAALVLALTSVNRNGAQASAVGQAVTQSQRLAKAAAQALRGHASAYGEVRDAAGVLVSNVKALREGSDTVARAPEAVQAELTALAPMVERADRNAKLVLDQQKTVQTAIEALRAINRQSNDLHETLEQMQPGRLGGGGAAELQAFAHLQMLAQRIGKSANEFLGAEGTSPEATFNFGKDLQGFRALLDGLQQGSTALRLAPTTDPIQRELLGKLGAQFDLTSAQSQAVLGHLPQIAAARDAQIALGKESEPLRESLQAVQERLGGETGVGALPWLLGIPGLLLLLGAIYGFLKLFVADQAQQAARADRQRRMAEDQQLEARRVNDANQAAILRLMNELQLVAEGDLTQQATVTEDITGAIADSVNYTVEELRNLVSQVQGTAARVTETTERVEDTSTELLAASDEQLREIRDTGEEVLRMAGRINNVSAQAQQSAQVARQSLQAAEGGQRAVRNAIGGMNAIRDQIQETSKRIKRLGESSQEIGEITELISDITEQTNVLALNAAIQAASAGEAGRGFSVVAEEVQRLAERSADATRQISALVKTIQADTQDAVAAMARSTQGVVEGARLSDATGAAFADIDRVTRQLAELIESISQQALREADNANVVAGNIQHIFAVTEQTGEGTRSTSQMVRELSRTAEELRQSVARFKIG